MTSCQIVDNMYAVHIIESKGFYFGESNLSSARFIVTFKFALFPLNFGYLSAPSTRFSETPAKDALSHVLIVY